MSLAVGVFSILGLAATLSGCYRDAAAPPFDGARAVVLLADGPSRATLVERVEVYVTEVAASTIRDPATREAWEPIVRPQRRAEVAFAADPGVALLGEGGLSRGNYRSVRLTMNTDSTRVILTDGRAARVRWPLAGELAIAAVVEEPLALEPSGTLIVLALDVARSFIAGFDPRYDFVFVPALRAVNFARVGSLAGAVRGDPRGTGVLEPVTQAAVTVSRAGPDSLGTAPWVAATAHTDPQGAFRIRFLLPGAYTVRIDAPSGVGLDPVTVPNILIVTGGESRLDVTLTGAGRAAQSHYAAGEGYPTTDGRWLRGVRR